jgi:hypothetical protein
VNRVVLKRSALIADLRIMERWFRSKEILYTPLTERDEEVRRDPRYRVGRWLGGDGYRFVALSFITAIALPVAVCVDWLQGHDEPDLRAQLVGLILWLLSVLVLYVWSFFARQDRSEKRRSYRFSRVAPDDDLDVAHAKTSLLSAASTPSERERALQLLISRNACSRPG